jgi:DNA-binding GntR family transcriptional regulator
MAEAKPGVTMPHMSYADIADDLAARIRDGRLPPGTQLHYQKLADEYGCPRSRIKLAMARLLTLGVVEYVQGVGTFVRGVN